MNAALFPAQRNRAAPPIVLLILFFCCCFCSCCFCCCCCFCCFSIENRQSKIENRHPNPAAWMIDGTQWSHPRVIR
jgi:hypothetical protein